MEECDDSVLLAAIAESDLEAFRTFYDRHAGRLLGAATKLCRDATVAEDVLQDVFLQVWRKAGTYSPERGDVGGWLFVICRNAAYQVQRRKKPEVQVETEPDPPPEDIDAADPEWAVTLERSLSLLSAPQRQAVQLVYYGGYSCSEGAERIGVPLPTFKSRVRSGVDRLRRALAMK
ncbi:MAG: sigma-70 family RNA polymerase sigma factor [Acidobacteriota bacterium]